MTKIEAIQDQWKDSNLGNQRGDPDGNLDLTFSIRVFFDLKDKLTPLAVSRRDKLPVSRRRSPIRWAPRQKQLFKSNFRRQILGNWNQKFWLKPSRYWAGCNVITLPENRNVSQMLMRNIRCCIDLEVCTDPAQAHLRVEAYDFGYSGLERIGGIVAASNGPLDQGSTPPGVMICCSADVEDQWAWNQKSHAHNNKPTLPRGSNVPANDEHRVRATVQHEFGHFLGLEHVGGRGSDPENYGLVNGENNLRLLEHHGKRWPLG